MTSNSKLWFALDMDEGVIAAARTRSEVMKLAEVPTSREPGYHWERHCYGPGSEEIVFGFRGEDSSTSVFIEHGAFTARRAGWGESLKKWRQAGSPIGVRMDESVADNPTIHLCDASDIGMADVCMCCSGWLYAEGNATPIAGSSPTLLYCSQICHDDWEGYLAKRDAAERSRREAEDRENAWFADQWDGRS